MQFQTFIQILSSLVSTCVGLATLISLLWKSREFYQNLKEATDRNFQSINNSASLTDERTALLTNQIDKVTTFIDRVQRRHAEEFKKLNQEIKQNQLNEDSLAQLVERLNTLELELDKFKHEGRNEGEENND